MLESENLVKRLSVNDEVIPERPLDKAIFTNAGVITGRPLYSDEQKAVIAATAIATSTKTATEVFDVSSSLVDRVKKDFLSDTPSSEKLRQSIYEELSGIRAAAKEKLLKALDLVNDNTLEAIPEKDRAKLGADIANKLSSVIERTIQRVPTNLDSSSHLHLYAPEQRELAAFEIKTVNVTPEANRD